MTKGYVIEKESQKAQKFSVFRDSRTGQMSHVKVMAKTTFENASARANSVIKALTLKPEATKKK